MVNNLGDTYVHNILYLLVVGLHHPLHEIKLLIRKGVLGFGGGPVVLVSGVEVSTSTTSLGASGWVE